MNKKLYLNGLSVKEAKTIIRQVNGALKKVSDLKEIPLYEGNMYRVNRLRTMEIGKRGEIKRESIECKRVNGLFINFLLVQDNVFLEILHQFVFIAIKKFRLGLPSRFIKVYVGYGISANDGSSGERFVRRKYFRKLPRLT